MDWKLDKLIGLQFENLAATTFCNAIKDSSWLKKKDFYPGAWAVEYTFLLALYRILNARTFSNILEFGLGQTSKMIYQYSSFYRSNALTIENNIQWRDYFFTELRGDISPIVEIHPLCEDTYQGKTTTSYMGLETLKKNKYDLIIVDGPQGSKYYSRSQIIDFTKYSISETFCIMIDDLDRVGEQETLQEVISVLRDQNINFECKIYKGFHDFAVVCSSDLHFLCSLGI